MSQSIVLPYELEREILEVAANSHRGLAFKLCTLSRYVQPWMEALMYDTVVLAYPFQASSELFMRTFNSRPESFFAKNVRQLYITSDTSFYEARRLLAACSGAREITCWVYPHTLKDNLLHQLPTQNLRRLSLTLESLWGLSPQAIDFTATLFPNLSHLEIVNPPGKHPALQVDWSGLLILPSLTHFALGELVYTDHVHFIAPLEKLLGECPQLKLVVVITRDERLIDQICKSGLDGDRRVVLQSEYNGDCTFSEYWQNVRDGRSDFWAGAERGIALRKDNWRLSETVTTAGEALIFAPVIGQPVAVS